MKPTPRRLAALCSLVTALALGSGCEDGDQGMSDGSAADDGSGDGADDGGTETGGDDGTMQARCESEERDDDFALGLAHEGAEMQVAIADADPAMPIRGDNAWTLAVTDSSGAPMTGLDLTVGPWMPDHGHGSPVQVNVTEVGDGEYLVEPLNLFMAGYWEITVEIEDPEDSVMFKVCVE